LQNVFLRGDAEVVSIAIFSISNPTSSLIFPWGDGIVHYNRPSLAVLLSNATFNRDGIYLSPFVLSESICQVSDTELRRLSIDNGAIELTDFTTIPALILCLASSTKFNVTAVGCDDCKLRIRSNLTGRKVATVNLDGELPLAVLITPSWGIIVVKSLNSLFVFDVNGYPIHKAPYQGEIVRWNAFQTREGFDFVVYQNGDRNCFCFEAACPQAISRLETGNSSLVSLDYDWHTNCFIFVAATGKVLLMTRT
jgi:hypothetical protein